MALEENHSPLMKTAINSFDSFFNWAQFIALTSIALTAVVGFAYELYAMILRQGINLGDLLLLFLYSEVIIMARAAMRSDRELTITMPIAIAVVAIGRYMVVNSEHNALHQLMYAGAILVLVGALFLWYWRLHLNAKEAKPSKTQLN